VNVQAGEHIDAEHVAHLIMHAPMVMGALTTQAGGERSTPLGATP
jgi:hypothetical protein